MKIRSFSLRNLTWLITTAALLTLSCQTEAEVKTGAPPTAAETAVEEKTPVITKAPPEQQVKQQAAEVTDEPAAEKPAKETPVTIAKDTIEPAVETPTDPNETAVTINNVDITEGQIEEQLKPQLDRVAMRLPAELLTQYKKQLRSQILEKMIVEQLLDEKVKTNGILVTDEDVLAYLEQSGASQEPPLSLEDIKALVEARGQSFEQTKQQIKRRMAYEKLMEAQWEDKINVPLQDAQKYYDSEDPNTFKQPETVTASHILIKPDTSDPNTDPNRAKEKAREKAQQLLSQIKAGADFATLARANSDCPSSAQGGNLGSFTRGRMVPQFEDAAFKLKVGQVSDVVETRFGFHIIKLTDRKDAAVIPFEQLKDNIITMLEQEKRTELAKQYVEKLKAEANIVYPPGKEPNDITPF